MPWGGQIAAAIADAILGTIEAVSWFSDTERDKAITTAPIRLFQILYSHRKIPYRTASSRHAVHVITAIFEWHVNIVYFFNEADGDIRER